MPLSPPQPRRDIHRRAIDLQAFAREDGLYDIEAHLVDRKPFDFKRTGAAQPTPAGTALHDLWIRLTVDDNYVVQAIEAASDATPFGICKEAPGTLSVLIGERIARGWSSLVKQRLRGAASCTHLMEMLIPMGTAALQGIRGLRENRAMELGPDGVPLKLDSCYAYGREREMVLKLWPQHYKGPAHAKETLD